MYNRSLKTVAHITLTAHGDQGSGS